MTTAVYSSPCSTRQAFPIRSFTLSWIFALVADLSNWSYIIKYDRKAGITQSEINMVGLPMLFAIIAVPLLLRSTYRLIRDYLACGVFVPRNAKYVDWRFVILLLPFLVHWSHVSAGITTDGDTFTGSFSYGSDMSIWALIATIVLIALYQFYTGLVDAPNKTPND